MHNVPFFYVNKFGISDKPKQRETEVSTTTKGVVFASFTPKLEYGWHVEQFVHTLYSFQRVPFSKGSGRSEWYLVFSPVVGALCWYFDTRYKVGLTNLQLALCFFCPFIWWDALLWLAIFSIMRVVIWTVLAFAVIYLGAHLQF